MQRRAAEQVTNTNYLLETAEVLSIAPITYYLGSILEHCVEPVGKLTPGLLDRTGRLSEILLYLLAFAVALAAICYRRYRRKQEQRQVARDEATASALPREDIRDL